MSDEAQAVDAAPEVDTDISEPVEVDVSESSESNVDIIQDPIVGDVDVPSQAEPEPDYRAQLAEERLRAERAAAEADAYRNMMNQGMTQQQQYDAQLAEQQRIESMTPEERIMYASEQAERRLEAKMMEADRRIHDANDRAAYAALKADNPMAAKLESDVEQFVKDKRADGQNIDRDVALTWLVGQRALEAAKKGPSQESIQAQTNITNSIAPSTPASGDKSGDNSSRQDSTALRNERLSKGKRSYR